MGVKILKRHSMNPLQVWTLVKNKVSKVLDTQRVFVKSTMIYFIDFIIT